MSEGTKIEIIPLNNPGVTQVFDRIFNENLASHKKWGGKESLEYPRYRAMKATLRSPALADEKMSNDEIREIVDFLVGSRKYSKAFSEWINVEEGGWNAMNFTQNIRRIHALGRNEIMRRKGKRGF